MLTALLAGLGGRAQHLMEGKHLTPRLIGLSGPMGAGKSTAARILQELTGLPIVPFAGPLKAMLEAAGVPPRNLYGTPADKAEPLAMLCGESARHAMQTLGTEWRDTIGRDLWLRMWEAKAGARGAIADDVRFTHEADAIRAWGGIVINVTRPGCAPSAAHASELCAVPFDFEVTNDGPPEYIRAQLRNVLAASRAASLAH